MIDLPQDVALFRQICEGVAARSSGFFRLNCKGYQDLRERERKEGK